MGLIRRLEAALKGWPDEALSMALIVAAAFLIMVALVSPALVKAVVLAWVVAP